MLIESIVRKTLGTQETLCKKGDEKDGEIVVYPDPDKTIQIDLLPLWRQRTRI